MNIIKESNEALSHRSGGGAAAATPEKFRDPGSFIVVSDAPSEASPSNECWCQHNRRNDDDDTILREEQKKGKPITHEHKLQNVGRERKTTTKD